MVKKASMRASLPPFHVMRIGGDAMGRQHRGEEIYRLDMGQPGSSAPAGVLRAAHDALDTDRIGYSESRGLLALRKKIVAHYEESYGLEVGTDNIFVTTGSSGAFLLAFLCAFDAGDSIAMALPGYPCYVHVPHLLGLRTVPLLADERHNFQPSVDLLERALDGGEVIDGLIIASPSNPAGYTIAEGQLRDVVEFCKLHDIRIISDEIYHGITYDTGRETLCVLGYDDSSIIINSFSKYFCMAGWRLGWAVVPNDLQGVFLTAAQNLYISAPMISQIAACEAFNCKDELSEKVSVYSLNRRRLLEELPRLGFIIEDSPDGGFYIYAGLPAGVANSDDFCAAVLDNCGVAFVPGIDFDAERGHRSVRFSYAETAETIEGAITKLKIYKQSGGF